MKVSRSRSSTSDRERWTYNRAHLLNRKTQDSNKAKGNLKHLHRFIFTCPCGALAEYNSALKQAKSSSRKSFLPKDGCTGRTCCGPRVKFWPAKFWPLQRKWRQLIRLGDRDLIRLPKLVSTGTFTLAKHLPPWMGPKEWPVTSITALTRNRRPLIPTRTHM